MRPQIGAVGKRPIANIALERLLAGMGPDVTLQQPGSRERFAANVALARQRMRADVHLQRAHRRVLFAAVLAEELLLAGAVVLLAVLAQARIGGVAFVAVFALELCGTGGGRGRCGGNRGGGSGDSGHGAADCRNNLLLASVNW